MCVFVCVCGCVCVCQNQTGTKFNELWEEKGVINHSKNKEGLSLETVKSQDSRNLPKELPHTDTVAVVVLDLCQCVD